MTSTAGAGGVGAGAGASSHMPATARQALVLLTQTMFPYHGRVDPMDKHIIQMSNQLASNTPFQVSLFFNAYFFPFWAASNFVMYALKFDQLNYIYQILLLAILVFMTVLEVVRLYLGYVGNLQEQVPELAGSWILTTILQFPMTMILLAVPDMKLLPLDCVVNLVLLLFVITQMISGLSALYFLSRQQVIRFQLQQFYDEALGGGGAAGGGAGGGGYFDMEPVDI